MMEIRLFNLSSGYKNEPEVSHLSVQILSSQKRGKEQALENLIEFTHTGFGDSMKQEIGNTL